MRGLKKTAGHIFTVLIVMVYGFDFRMTGMAGSSYPGETLRIMFWNVENFFYYIDDGAGDADKEFSSRGSRRWTKARFYEKCSLVAKSIFFAASSSGGMPDIVCFAEIENKKVLRRLIDSTLLRKCGYSVVHYDSPDKRGIDVGLIYNSGRLDLLKSYPVGVYVSPDGDSLFTRDFLYTEFIRRDGIEALEQCFPEYVAQLPAKEIENPKYRPNIGADDVETIVQPPSGTDEDNAAFSLRRKSFGDTLSLIVCHLPSKVGGGKDVKRAVAVRRLKELADSVVNCGRPDDYPRDSSGEGNVTSYPGLGSSGRGYGYEIPEQNLKIVRRQTIIAGDFNDIPQSAVFGPLNDNFTNLALPLSRARKGSLRYNGKWELIDMFWVENSLAKRCRMEILEIPFLTAIDNVYAGRKPLRTYSGPRYLGGVSDHLPILLTIFL